MEANVYHPMHLIVAIIAAYVTWRIWSFTILPAVYPEDPKQYPYSVPCELLLTLIQDFVRIHANYTPLVVGHAVAFSRNSDRVCSEARLVNFTGSSATNRLTWGARRYFGDTREPFAITVAGQTLYIVTSPEDANLVYRNTKTLTFDEFVQDMIETLGMTPGAVKRAFPDDESTRSLPSVCQELYRLQFLPGDNFSELWASIQRRITTRLSLRNTPKASVLKESSESLILSLWNWTRAVLVEEVSKAIFGRVILELEPNLVEIFAAFDDNTWKLTHKYPKFAARDVFTAHAKLASMFKRYLSLPRSDRSDACWVIKALEQKFIEFGVEDNDLAICMVMPLWVINSNAYKLCFWMIALILQDPELTQNVRDEAEEALLQGEDGLADRLEKCECLVAVFHEVLRINTSSASIRGIAKDTPLGSVTLRANNKVMIPYRQLHMSQVAWGRDAFEFNASRFRQGKLLQKSSSFRPFGGGNTYCTGRVIAMREVLTFVAIALCRLDLKLPPDSVSSAHTIMAMVDVGMPTLGVLPPLPGKDVEVLISKTRPKL